MTLDTSLLDRCVRAYMAHHAYVSKASAKRTRDAKHGPSVDDLLREAGITWDSDPKLWRAYETAVIERVAPDRVGPPPPRNSRRRPEIIRRMLEQGHAPREIAKAAGVSRRTVHRHVVAMRRAS